MSDASKFVNDVIAMIHGKPAAPIADDAKKLLDDVEEIIAGLAGAGPYAPAILSDVASLTAEGAAIVASRGIDLPEFLLAGASLKKLAEDLAKAEAAFVAGVSNYKAAAHLVVTVPKV